MKQTELSIITPIFNGSKYIPNYIKALKNLELSKKVHLKVILVDNGSTDDSVEKIRMLIKEGGIGIKNLELYSFTEIQSSYAARNFGVQKTNSDYYIFTDIDCEINSEYIINLYQIISKHSYDIIAGDVKLYTESNPNIFEIYDSIFGFNIKAYKDEDTGITANLVVSDNCIENLGGFDPYISGADRNFCKKAKREGYSFYFKESIFVNHPARNSFKDLYNKTVRIANGKAEYVSKKKFIIKGKIFLKNLVSCILQIHQIKRLYTQRHIYSRLNFTNRLKLFALTFYLGAFGRIKINHRLLEL